MSRNGERATGKTGSGRVQSDQVVAAHQVRCIFEFFDGTFADDFSAGGVGEGSSLPLGRVPAQKGAYDLTAARVKRAIAGGA